MGAFVDDELQAEFVAESRELIGKLDEQLIALERSPEDRELLNAVFRNFHTVKGGAGFFELTGMVEICHACEDAFNALREGRAKLTAELMDDVFATAALVREMLDAVEAGGSLAHPDADMVARLRAFAAGATAAPPPKIDVPKGKKGKAKPEATEPSQAAPDPFSEDEFEALLDQIHGKGATPGAASGSPAVAPSVPKPATASGLEDPFSEDEFEALLDQIHGKGTVPGAAAAAPSHAQPSVAPPVARPEPRHEAKTESKSESKSESKPEAESSIRVDTARIDEIVGLVGELVLLRNRLKLRAVTETERRNVGELDGITSSLQAAVMRMRMQPIRKLFGRFPRLARDIARKIGKDVEIVTAGEDTELDKSLAEALNDPLLHMIRNAVDHGIEEPDTREMCGKSRRGHLRLAAEQQGDRIVITLSDDGGGIDPERIKAKALSKGLIDAEVAATMSPDEALQLIFMPGFSTREQVSELSGRGVGMDVVRSAIGALHGSVRIDSRVGEGTCFDLHLPLTLAMQPALMVSVGSDERLFALPMQQVVDVFRLDESTVQRRAQAEYVQHREHNLRLIRLASWASAPLPEHGELPHVVMVDAGRERCGVVVQRVRSREEIVVKPMGSMLRGLTGIAGGTVTGDGRVALLLDVQGLLDAQGNAF
jgi:two-component system chemotaxis sensor kinase CheA